MLKRGAARFGPVAQVLANCKGAFALAFDLGHRKLRVVGEFARGHAVAG